MAVGVTEKKIDNFSWSVQISTIEMTLKVQNWGALSILKSLELSGILKYVVAMNV